MTFNSLSAVQRGSWRYSLCTSSDTLLRLCKGLVVEFWGFFLSPTLKPRNAAVIAQDEPASQTHTSPVCFVRKTQVNTWLLQSISSQRLRGSTMDEWYQQLLSHLPRESEIQPWFPHAGFTYVTTLYNNYTLDHTIYAKFDQAAN